MYIHWFWSISDVSAKKKFGVKSRVMNVYLVIGQWTLYDNVSCFSMHERVKVMPIHAGKSKHSIMHYVALASCHFIVSLQIVENFSVIFSSEVRYFHNFTALGKFFWMRNSCGIILMKRIGDLTEGCSVRNRVWNTAHPTPTPTVLHVLRK